MPLFLIGLGLGDVKDVTIKGLEAIKSCDHIYLEEYTSILANDKQTLEAFYGKSIHDADRNMVESNAEAILEHAATTNVALLVVGDPLCATTHTDIFLRAAKKGIKVNVIHNASIISAVGISGMQVYRFGISVSIPLFTEKWRPYSFYDNIKKNAIGKLHTLLLLDIKVKEPTIESLCKGKKLEYMPPRYMTAAEAAQQILEAEYKMKEGVVSKESKAIVLARIGTENQLVCSTTLGELACDCLELGPALHSLVLCSTELHEMEVEMYNFYWNNRKMQ